MTNLLRILAPITRTIPAPRLLSPATFPLSKRLTGIHIPRRHYSEGKPRKDDNDDSNLVKFPPGRLEKEAQIQSPAAHRMQLMKEVYSSSALPHNFQVLPPIPPRPTYPVEWLSDDDTRKYLYPLFTRHWAVAKYKPLKQKERKFCQVLSKVFIFRMQGDAEEFAGEVRSIADKLVHHPTVLLVREKLVILRVTTDDAFVKPFSNSKPVTMPGITIQDIRLAYRLERVWEKYWEQGKVGLRAQGTHFPGRMIHSVQVWGLVHAKLWNKQRRDAVLAKAGRLPARVAADEKKRRKKIPRWKKFKWKNQARQTEKSRLRAAVGRTQTKSSIAAAQSST